jgi:hypothetical protein
LSILYTVIILLILVNDNSKQFILNWINLYNIDFNWIKNESNFQKDIYSETTITLGLCNIEQKLYILRWNKTHIFGNYRDWMKKFNQCKYKCNIMTTSSLGDIFYNNVLQEINWKKTFEFIGKGTLIGNRKTNSIDNEIRAYKIKNLLKTLPTYEIFKRKELFGRPT